MKIIIVPDLHGRDSWKSIDVSNFDEIIFLGDYVDSFDKTDKEILSNLKEVIKFKNDNSEKVKLLIGNHDFQYMFLGQNYKCSGYRQAYAAALRDIFQEHKSLFAIAHNIERKLFTHAGVCKVWWKTFQKNFKYIDYVNIEDVCQTLNWSLDTGDRHMFWYDDSPLWARPWQMKNDLMKGLDQYVGHTQIEEITTYFFDTDSITYCDVLGILPFGFHQIEMK